MQLFLYTIQLLWWNAITNEFLRVISPRNFKLYGSIPLYPRRSPHAFMNNVWFKHGSSRIYCFIWFETWIEWNINKLIHQLCVYTQHISAYKQMTVWVWLYASVYNVYAITHPLTPNKITVCAMCVSNANTHTTENTVWTPQQQNNQIKPNLLRWVKHHDLIDLYFNNFFHFMRTSEHSLNTFCIFSFRFFSFFFDCVCVEHWLWLWFFCFSKSRVEHQKLSQEWFRYLQRCASA